MCDGRILPAGKKKPVTLVSTVVARKIAVQPLSGLEPSMPMTTMAPAKIPIRLKMTWNRVNVDIDIPRIMAPPLEDNAVQRWIEAIDLNAA
jgi:hypothetical protein